MQATIPEIPKITWIFLFVMLYWGYCIFWGIRGSIRSRTAEDYFIAGRRLSLGVFVLAATATSFSGWTFIGHPGQIYTDGLPYAYASFYAILIPLTGVLFLKRQWLLGRRFGFITPGEMLAYYFQSELLRLLVVVVALVFSVPYLGLQLRACGFLFSVLTDGVVGVEFGMWVLSSVVVSYVASGGLRTAAAVGSLQAVLLAAGIVIIGLITLNFTGGWNEFLKGLAALTRMDTLRTPQDYSHYVAIPGVIQFVSDGPKAAGGAWTGVMILTSLFGLMGLQSAPAFSMLAFANHNPNAFAPQQVWASSFAIGFILLTFTAVQGLGGHFLGADQAFLFTYPELANPVLAQGLNSLDLVQTPGGQDILVPQLINLLSGAAPWLVGLLAVCALAAMESTASTYMATAGGILTRDLVKRFVLPNADDPTQKFLGRMGVVLVVLLALSVATTSTDTLVLLGDLAVSYGLQMWPALIGACYWPFLTRQGVTLGLVAGLVVVTLTDQVGMHWLGITAWGPSPWTIDDAAWGIVCNFSVAVLVSLLTRDGRARKEEFHRLLREQAAVPSAKRRWILSAWIGTVLWLLFAVGPGAVIGNTLFADPNDPASWPLGIPSIWIWQLLGWGLGVGLMWFLAYYLELGRMPGFAGATVDKPAGTASA